MITAEEFNRRSAGRLPGHLGVVITLSSADEMRGQIVVRDALMAPNGFLHAGTVVTLADTLSDYGCLMNLPEGASGFTTVELKSNHLGTARDGTIDGVARALHRGRTTQVWDAIVTHRESGRTLALFRCTQLVLYAPGAR